MKIFRPLVQAAAPSDVLVNGAAGVPARRTGVTPVSPPASNNSAPRLEILHRVRHRQKKGLASLKLCKPQRMLFYVDGQDLRARHDEIQRRRCHLGHRRLAQHHHFLRAAHAVHDVHD